MSNKRGRAGFSIGSGGRAPAPWFSTIRTRSLEVTAMHVGRRPERLGGLRGAALAALFICVSSTAALCQPIDANLWGTDGIVTAIARSGNTIYVGGGFTRVGPNSGGGVPVSVDAGTSVPGYARVNGAVFTSSPDGDGGWYIGGSFESVAGLPRANLAHILADGTVSPWQPDPDGTVLTLVRKGATLYVGGGFTHIASVTRTCLAAFKVSSGALRPLVVSIGGVNLPRRAVVESIVLVDDRLIIGGEFLRVNSRQRYNLASMDARSGRLESWTADADRAVHVLLRKDASLFVGGEFAHIGRATRAGLAELDLRSGDVDSWNPSPMATQIPFGSVVPSIRALLTHGRTLYVGGTFTGIGGAQRANLAATDLQTGLATDWAPDPGGFFADNEVSTLAMAQGSIYVGGYFRHICGQERAYAAKVDALTGKLGGWDPKANNEVRSLMVRDDVIFTGGVFTSLGDWAPRLGLAALNATTGEPTPWRPDPDGLLVSSIVVGDGTVFVGGDFSNIGGLSRMGLAAIDPVTGNATAWDPQADGATTAMALSGGILYAGGSFGRIGGSLRSRLAALDVRTGLATLWDPGANDPIRALAVSQGLVYAGGFFTRIGGQRRNSLAAIDAVTGLATSWNPNPDAWVNAIGCRGDTVYVGGGFFAIGGKARTALAAVDAVSGQCIDWNAGLNDEVKAIALGDDALYAGGQFQLSSGGPRGYVGSFDLSTGAPGPWTANANGFVWSLSREQSRLYVGGRFSSIGGLPCSNLAGISVEGGSLPALAGHESTWHGGRELISAVFPNPVSTSGVIRFLLPQSGMVSLSIYDLQGREVAGLIDHETRPSGEYALAFHAEGWSPGCYIYRLEAAGAVRTQKLMILH